MLFDCQGEGKRAGENKKYVEIHGDTVEINQ